MPTATEVFTFALTLFVFSLYDRFRKPTFLLLGGLSLGIAALARPNILLFGLTLPIWLWLLHRDDGWNTILRRLSPIVVAATVVILPCTVRNYVVGHEFVLISAQGGANFYMGNNADADGQTASFPAQSGVVSKFGDHIWTDSKALAEQRTGRSMSPSEVSSYWFGEGLRYATGHPLSWLELSLKKLYLTFCGEELFNNEDPLSGRRYAFVYSLFIWSFGLRFPYGLLAPLCVLGILTAFRKQRAPWLPILFVLSQVASVALFFVCSRYRQPMIPAMIILAVVGVSELWAAFKSAKRRQFVKLVSAGVILAIILNPPFTVASASNRSMYHVLVGRALINDSKSDLAISELSSAGEIDSRNNLAYHYLGMAYANTGHLDLALNALKKAEALNPNYAKTLMLLTRVYYDLKDYRGAYNYLERTRALDSTSASGYVPFWIGARSALAVGNVSVARGYLDRLLALNPNDRDAKALLDSLGLK